MTRNLKNFAKFFGTKQSHSRVFARPGFLAISLVVAAVSKGEKMTHEAENSSVWPYISLAARPCLLPRKFCKIFHIPRHIESLDSYMEY